MSLLPFDPLPPFKPRQFVPVTLDPGNWQQIEPLFDQLESGIAVVVSVGDLEAWLLAWNELTSAVEEESSRRFIAMCCNTGDPAAEKSYLDFVANIDPHLKSRQFRLEKLFIACPDLAGLPSPDYDVLIRGVRNSVELFREENIPLEVEEQLLAQQYQKLS
ncbi:MAG: Peptidase family [Akkermansiaceae bacterium]|nr:Peptidase family [Akkermansiaceae bacterium]